MDEKEKLAREHFLVAIRTMVTSTSDLQGRIIEASPEIRKVNLDEFDGDLEMKLKFARILDLLAPDGGEDADEVADMVAARMSDLDAIRLGHLICDFFYDLE